jgi:hypothetical protein
MAKSACKGSWHLGSGERFRSCACQGRRVCCVQEFYGLGEEFPLQTHLVTRCLDAADRPKKCYYVSDAVRKILMMDENESLKVIAVGLKVRLPH